MIIMMNQKWLILAKFFIKELKKIMMAQRILEKFEKSFNSRVQQEIGFWELFANWLLIKIYPTFWNNSPTNSLMSLA